MCTVIVTIRAVLWYITSLAGSLLILVSLFTNRWLHSEISLTNPIAGATGKQTGLFLNCVDMDLVNEDAAPALFDGECIPKWEATQKDLMSFDDESVYPHAWKGAVVCFVIGLGLMLITDFFALMTLCCRRCICCSVFTVCGSLQSFAALLFTLGLVAFPAGWGAAVIKDDYCGSGSRPFVLDSCTLGLGFWLAVAGTVCAWLSSSLAIWAYQSTKTIRCETRQDEGDHCICLP